MQLLHSRDRLPHELQKKLSLRWQRQWQHGVRRLQVDWIDREIEASIKLTITISSLRIQLDKGEYRGRVEVARHLGELRQLEGDMLGHGMDPSR